MNDVKVWVPDDNLSQDFFFLLVNSLEIPFGKAVPLKCVA